MIDPILDRRCRVADDDFLVPWSAEFWPGWAWCGTASRGEVRRGWACSWLGWVRQGVVGPGMARRGIDK